MSVISELKILSEQEEEIKIETKKEIEESLKDVSSEHLKSISTSLERLEHYERIMLVGYEDLQQMIMEYNPSVQIEFAQVINQKLLVYEFKNLLSKTKPILSTKNYEDLLNRIEILESILREEFKVKGEIIKHSSIQVNQIRKTRKLILGIGFGLIAQSSPGLRQMFIEKLKHILFTATKKEKEKKW